MLAEKVNQWIEEYKKEGRVEGEAKGKAEGMAAVFRRMKDFGMSVAEIAKVTGFSEDEISKMI